MRGELIFDHEDWDNISIDAKDLIIKCLKKDPEERLTSRQAADHIWFTSSQFQTVQVTAPQYINKLSLFTSSHKLKRAALIIMADKLSENELSNLRQKCREYDPKNTGFISYSRITQVVEELNLNDCV